MSKCLLASVVLGIVVILAGCGSGVDSVQPTRRDVPNLSGYSTGPGGTPPQAAQTASASEMDFQGWKALRMQNGLVEIICVPAIGGRIMSYAMAGHNALYVNPAEYGKVYKQPTSENERKWHNFGGYKTWPAPQSEWKGPPDPLNSALDGGEWEGQITNPGGDVAEITLTSPADKSVTGLQIIRKVRLYAGTTKVTVRETFKNVSAKPIKWSIWDVTQVPGSLERGKDFSPQARLYIPLNPESKAQTGFIPLISDVKDTGQMGRVADGKVLEVTYGMKTDKVGADSVAGWAASYDGVAQYAFVKRFSADKSGQYPDRGCSVEAYTAADLPYMELEVLSPLYDIAPGKEVSFEQAWYTAKMTGPIVGATDAVAIRTPVSVDIKDGQATLSGEFGVFAPGQLKIAFMDDKNHAAGDPVTVSVDPSSPVVLSQKLKLPAGAVKLALKINDAKDKLVGMVAELPIASDLSKATAKKDAAAATDSGKQ